MKPTILKYSNELFLIEVVPPLLGFDQFIGIWLYKGEITFIVDVGPAVTLPFLIESLEALAVTHLDYILLTHIHMDHAGAIGQLSVRFPETPIVCHGKGIPHLVDPSRLWEGSLKTLGETAKAYGPMVPVPTHLLIPVDRFHSTLVRAMFTPGHSPHHVSYMTAEALFAGEAGGVCLQLPDGRTWLRPATPPQHVLPTALSSVDALIAAASETICYTHFGIQKNADQLLHRHRRQLLFWEQEIQKKMNTCPPETVVIDCLAHLLSADPELSGYGALAPAQREREKFFLVNSIKGLLGYLNALTDKP